MKCLVVGGNGFIGSHLADALITSGHEVTVFDRFSAGIQRYASTEIRGIQGDFLDNADLHNAVSGQDLVFHFLSTTTPATAEHDPSHDVRVNIGQSVELLAQCAAANVKKVFFASTGGAIYGATGRNPITESHSTSPISPYAIGKLTIEHYLEYFRITKGLEYTVFRISNPYGPRQSRQKRQGLIPIVLRQILKGTPVAQFGDGSMVRDYVYVSDLIRMLTRAIDGPCSHRLYNVGSGVGHSVIEVLKTIRDVVGTDFQVVRHDTPPTFVPYVVLDTGRFDREFGRGPSTQLSEGILETWESIRGEA